MYDTCAELQLVSKQFYEGNGLKIQPIEKLTECSTMNGSIFGYDGFVEVNVQIPGRDFSEDHLFLVTFEISFKADDLHEGLTYRQFEQHKVVSEELNTEIKPEMKHNFTKVKIEDLGEDLKEDLKYQEQGNSWIP